MFMMSDDPDCNLYNRFLRTIESTILGDQLIYGHTKTGLKFLQRLLKERNEDCLFVNLRDSQSFKVEGKDVFEERKRLVAEERQRLLQELKEVKNSNPHLKIVCTDVKEGATAFGLIAD